MQQSFTNVPGRFQLQPRTRRSSEHIDPLSSLAHPQGVESDVAKVEFARAQLEVSSRGKPAVNQPPGSGFRNTARSCCKTKRLMVSRVCFGFFVSGMQVIEEKRKEKNTVLGPSFLLMQPFGLDLKRHLGDRHNHKSNNTNSQLGRVLASYHFHSDLAQFIGTFFIILHIVNSGRADPLGRAFYLTPTPPPCTRPTELKRLPPQRGAYFDRRSSL